MTDLARISQKVFGSSAGLSEIGIFGSLAAGSPATTTDVADIQNLDAFMGGWYDAILANNSPCIEDMNALHHLITHQIAYILQKGVPEYDVATGYYAGAIVSVDGKLYRALQNSLAFDPVTSPTQWEPLIFEEEIPRTNFSDWDRTIVNRYLDSLRKENGTPSLPICSAYNGVASLSGSEVFSGGGIYSPRQKRIYFCPTYNFGSAKWYYLDCVTGEFVEHNLGGAALTVGYSGGAYSPNQERIYLAQSFGGSPRTTWHYIDCLRDKVVAYSNGVTAVNGAYQGAVYSPLQDRIYFIPFFQSDETDWHYVDCSTGNVVAYAHGATLFDISSYSGGAYSPTQNRIYMAPFTQGNQSVWHYIDCSDGSVQSYANPFTLTIQAYRGAVYCPTKDRIYFIPHGQASEVNWHYIDCATGALVEYAHYGVLAPQFGYAGGVYHPLHDRIYFAPTRFAIATNWAYIDCATGTMGETINPCSSDVVGTTFDYNGGVYSPELNRAYFIPSIPVGDKWHYIGGDEKETVSPRLMANTVFNNSL